MAEDVEIGTDKSDMMATLKYAKQEPVNFAFGLGEETTFAVLILDQDRPGKKIGSEMADKFVEARNIRNKQGCSMEKRLIKTLEGTRFSNVQIVVDEGQETAGE